MNAPASIPIRIVKTGDSTLASRLRKELDAEVLFDAREPGPLLDRRVDLSSGARGRRCAAQRRGGARAAMAIAADEGVPILPRGAGSSQCGQAVGAALVIDHTKFSDKIIEIDAQARKAIVQPGVVLDSLNAALRKHGLWFPVDVSTSAQATLGGMAGNNSCGSRSTRSLTATWFTMFSPIDAVTVGGERWHFAPAHRGVRAGRVTVRSLRSSKGFTNGKRTK